MIALQIGPVLGEIDPPAEKEKVRWLLWTTEAITSLPDILARLREYALRWRIEELQEQSESGGPLPSLRGDIWDSLLRSTYGAVFGKDWFRQKELELMRAGFRGRPFTLWKFRTMVVGAEGQGSGVEVAREDPRVTRPYDDASATVTTWSTNP